MVRHMRCRAATAPSWGPRCTPALLERLADDVEAGGPAADVLAGHEEDRGPSALAAPPHGLGAPAGARAGRPRGWPCTTPRSGVTATRPRPGRPCATYSSSTRRRAAALLHQPPQTNEVGRAAVLAGGLAHVVAWRRPTGAPRRDRCQRRAEPAGRPLPGRVRRPAAASARSDSPVVLRDAWTGAAAPDRWAGPSVVERLGCDLQPGRRRRPTEGRLLLTSYVWADQRDRLERLRAAFEVARSVPVALEPAGAGDVRTPPGARARAPPRSCGTRSCGSTSTRPSRPSVDDALDRLGATADDTTGAWSGSRSSPRGATPSAPREMLVRLRTWPGRCRADARRRRDRARDCRSSGTTARATGPTSPEGHASRTDRLNGRTGSRPSRRPRHGAVAGRE